MKHMTLLKRLAELVETATHDSIANTCTEAIAEIESLRMQRDELVAFLYDISRRAYAIAVSYPGKKS